MRTIHQVLDIDAAPASVWAALTEADMASDYAVEPADDYYGGYNFDRGHYLESLRLLCARGTGKPFQAVG